eukprot:PITA_12079
MAKGYAQKEGIDYEETFTPVVRYTSFRLVIFLETQMGWQIHEMDVKTTFLNELIEEEVCIEQPYGFETHERHTHVCRLKKYLYGLKQAQGMVCLYVDDLFLIGSSGLIEDCKRNLVAKFDLKDLGLMCYFLRLEVWQKDGETFIGKGRYTTYILKRFIMQDCRPMFMPMIINWKNIDASNDKDVDLTLYRQLIGSLTYLVNTRPDIYFTFNTLSQFMVELKRVHWVASRHILRYVHSTVEYGLRYTRGDDVRLCGYIDVDWESNLVDRKSTSGYCFSVVSGIVSWCSRKKKLVALSFAEAE